MLMVIASSTLNIDCGEKGRHLIFFFAQEEGFLEIHAGLLTTCSWLIAFEIIEMLNGIYWEFYSIQEQNSYHVRSLKTKS